VTCAVAKISSGLTFVAPARNTRSEPATAAGSEAVAAEEMKSASPATKARVGRFPVA
jgi:hypothetical protein